MNPGVGVSPAGPPGTTVSEPCVDDPKWSLAASLGFGFITPPRADAGASIHEGLQILEDGTRFGDHDWTGHIHRGDLPEAFGFRVPALGYGTDSSRTYGLYPASLEDLGRWAPRVSELMPGTSFRVLLDRGRARVFGYLETLHAFVPVLWVDRFGHWVAFRWQSTSVGDGGALELEVKNERGQGLQVRWRDPGSAGEEALLLRADFIGMTAPTLVVWGIPQRSFSEAVSGGPLKGRPTRVQLVAPASLQAPTSSPDPSGAAPPLREWQLAYGAAGDELGSLRSPNGVRTTFRYATYRYPTGHVRRGVRETVSVDERTGASWSQTWMRRETESATPGWEVSLLSGFWDGAATEGRTVTRTYLLRGADPEQAFLQSLQTLGDSGTARTLTFEPAPERARGPASFGSLHQTTTGEPTLDVLRTFDSESGNLKEELWTLDGTLVETRRFSYQAPFADLGAGLPDAVAVQRRGLPEVEERYGYSKEGLVTRHTVLGGGQEMGRTFAFDAEGRLQATGELASWTQEPGLHRAWVPGPFGPLRLALSGKGLEEPLRESWEYGDRGQVTRHTGASGSGTSKTYDLWGRPLTVQVDGTPTLTYTYPDERTRVWAQGSLTGAEQVDGFGRPLWTLRGDGVRETFGTDTYGRVVAVQESQGGITRPVRDWAYDALDRPVSERIAGNPVQKMTYGARGIHRVLTVATPQGVPSTRTLDPWGQLVERVDATGTCRTTYNEFGQATRVEQQEPGGKTQIRRFIYDGLGKLVIKREPETGTTTFARFNGLGQPGLATDAGGRATRRTYDALGRLRELSSGPLVLKHFYRGPFLAGRSSSDGITQTFTQDPSGVRVVGESVSVDGVERNLHYGYDPLGRLAQVSYPSGRTVEYRYDDLNRISEVRQNGQALAWVDYDGWGNRTALRFASGAQSLWRMDATGRKGVAWTVTHGGGQEVQSYAYDAEARLTLTGGWNLEHDAGGQLLRASRPGLDLVYGYDGFGNNTSQIASGALGGSYNAYRLETLPDNRLPGVQTNGALTGWVVEANGETSQMGTEVAGRRHLGLGWDRLGRLAEVTDSLTGAVRRYRYAPSGLRVSMADASSPGADRLYVYSDGGLLLAECRADGGWLRDVIYLGDVAIAEADGAGIHELHADPLGTPVLITRGQTGDVEGRQAFGPYGEGLDAQGYRPLTGYTGHLQTDPTGLIYMKGRFYSPAWHRFLNSDQGADPASLNQFAYGGGAPLERIDPSGLGSLSARSGAGPGPGGSGSWGPAGVEVHHQEGRAQAANSVVKSMWVTSYGPPHFPAGGHPTSSGKPVGPGSVASWRFPSTDIPEVRSTATGTGTTYYPYGANVTVWDAKGKVVYTGIVQDKGPDVPGGENMRALLAHGIRPESWIDVWTPNPERWRTGWYGVKIQW